MGLNLPSASGALVSRVKRGRDLCIRKQARHWSEQVAGFARGTSLLTCRESDRSCLLRQKQREREREREGKGLNETEREGRERERLVCEKQREKNRRENREL